jgi:hypothetical protein
VGSLFAIADKLSQAASAALSTARAAFDAAAEEESKVGVWVLLLPVHAHAGNIEQEDLCGR